MDANEKLLTTIKANTEGQRLNIQVAPYPEALEGLVARCKFRAHEGWRVRLADAFVRDVERDVVHGEETPIAGGLTLIITTKGYDTYHPERGPNYRVQHFFSVPAATYNIVAWRRWLFECFAKVDLHETMENFVLDGEPDLSRPFAPLHGPGDDPYVVHQYATELQKRTRFTGEVVDD